MALGEAIHPSSKDPRELEKARRLRRHLFVDLSPPALSSSGVASRDAERLRADLADLTTFGAGLHLTDGRV